MRRSTIRALRQSLLLALAALLALAGSVPAKAATATDWSVAVVKSTMQRFTPAAIGGWSYPVGLYLYGQYQVYLRTHDASYLAYLKAWVDRFVSPDGTVDQSFTSLDSMLAGRLLVILHHETGQPKYAIAAAAIRDRLTTYPRTSDGGFWHADTSSRAHQLWDDGLYMVVPFLVEYGREFGDSSVDAEAVKQLTVYANHLQQPNGLLQHAYDESKTASWANPATGLSPEQWCRANGWYGMALVTTLDDIPAAQPGRARLLADLDEFAAGLQKYQDPATGRWFQVIDKPAGAGNWTETSCSSMNAYTLSRAAQQGYIDQHYAAVAQKAYHGVLARISLSKGLTDLTNISIGTNVGDYAYYIGRTQATNDFHGLGSFLIMNEQLRGPAGAVAKSAAHSALPVFNVKDYGATGNGTHNDTSAINKAIVAANAASGGGIVEVPPGTYLSANSIHMLSNVTIQLDSGSTIVGSGAKTYDAPEPNPNDKYQDFGHSHFHDAMIWGDRLTNIGFTGSGTIDGGGHLVPGTPATGQADKIVSLTRCAGLTLSGITLKRGGHFGALINGCANVVSDHLTIATTGNRDGWNIISTTNVAITDITIASNDDALVFKSDWALGQRLPSGHVSVNGATLSAQCCNALMFGSETCGPFTDYTFNHIAITGAGKSGLGMVSMDGADISDVHYSNVTMSGVSSPIMEKIGGRLRCGGTPTPGHISNVTFTNVTGTGAASPQYSPTLWGLDATHRVTGVTFDGVNLTVPGGSGTVNTGVPSNNGDYNPNSIGTRPAYGWYLHQVDGIQFTDSSVRFTADDARPAVIANAAGTVGFSGFTVRRGSRSPYDIGLQSVSGYCVANSQTTAGGKVKVTSTGSTPSC